MKTLLKLATIASLGFSPIAFAQDATPSPKAMTLDQLLQKVKKDRLEDRSVNKAREAEFAKNKNQQARLLAEAKAELKKTEELSEQLKATFSENEKTLTELEEKLRLTMGTLGEMFGVVRQVAGDTRGVFESSIVSAQLKNRNNFMGDLAERKEIPKIKELERLWVELQTEMTESGKVVKFKAPVTQADGSKTDMEVTRVGAFNLVADGKYLRFVPETQKIVELGRQPSGRYLGLIPDFEEASSGYHSFAVDPSRGAILSLLVQAPSLKERISQGGIVGYVIIALLFLGLIIVAERMVTLTLEGKKVKKQLKSGSPDESNPLGRLLIAYKSSKNLDLENLELKLNESILKSIPKLERGIGTIKILSAIAPLLGLLGTVTGMIGTFQSITLFGTGDPKLMAGGISQALVTTVLGLVCAIPLTLLHNLVSDKSQGLIQVLEEQSAGLMADHIEEETA